MKTMQLPNGAKITSEIDLPLEKIVYKALTRTTPMTLSDFDGDQEFFIFYKKAIETLKPHINSDDQRNKLVESIEATTKYYNLAEWKREAKKHKLTIRMSGMSGALHKSAKIYYADGESGGGYFYLYSPNNGEGSLSVVNK